MPIKYQPPSIQRGREAEHETQKAAVNDVNEMNGSTRTHRKKRKAGKIEVSVNGGDGGLCYCEISKYFIHFSASAFLVKQSEK